jgi:hypothetical protein
MHINYITVDSGEAIITTYKDSVTSLATFNLGGDIAITLFNPACRKVGLARGFDVFQLDDFVSSIIDNEMIDSFPIVQVRLFGGSATSESTEEIQEIIRRLNVIDAGRDIFNIVSADIGGKSHPESLRITAWDGVVGEV